MSQPCRYRVALSSMSLLAFVAACSSQMQPATSSGAAQIREGMDEAVEVSAVDVSDD